MFRDLGESRICTYFKVASVLKVIGVSVLRSTGLFDTLSLSWGSNYLSIIVRWCIKKGAVVRIPTVLFCGWERGLLDMLGIQAHKRFDLYNTCKEAPESWVVKGWGVIYVQETINRVVMGTGRWQNGAICVGIQSLRLKFFIDVWWSDNCWDVCMA